MPRALLLPLSAFVLAAAALTGCSGSYSLCGLLSCAQDDKASSAPAQEEIWSGQPTVVDTRPRAGQAWAEHSEAPIARNFPADGQFKLQSGRHWQILAEDAAQTLWAELQRQGRCGVGAPPCPALYVEPPAEPSGFSRAFANALLTALVDAGAPVVRDAAAPLHVAIEAQTARFSANRPQYRLGGAARELGPGIWALADVARSPQEALQAEATPTDYSWAHNELAAGKTPAIELILSLSVAKDSRYLARFTRVYYVADGDAALYGDAADTPAEALPKTTPKTGIIELEK
jgi:hypothetical protein